MPKKNNSYLIQHLIAIIGIILLTSCDKPSPEEPIKIEKITISEESKSLNNKGVGEMGYFNYSQAAETFENLIKINPDWDLAQQNLAIALLNRQKPGDEEKALKMAESMSITNDENLVAHYIVGILKFNQGLCEQALPHFNTIISKDNTDAYAMYFSGQCELQNGNIDTALQLYQKAIQADSYLRSAYYGGFMAAQRLQNSDLAKEMLNTYQRMESNPRAKLAEIKYTRMGPKAIAQAYSTNDILSVAKQKPQAPFFMPPIVLDSFETDIQNFGLVNMQQTLNSQLYVIENNQLKIYQDFLSTPQTIDKFTLTLGDGDHHVAWGDINNDGLIDAYITGANDQLYLQNATGFESINMDEFGFNQLSSSAVRLSDTDHDGDLDILLLNEAGIFEIWNNNLNNTFTPLSKSTTLTSDKGYKSIFIGDLDSDRDADIVLVGVDKLSLLINDRMWDYQLVNSAVFDNNINSFSLVDNDINGRPEMNLLFENNNIGVFELEDNKINQVQTIIGQESTTLISIDSNGNGIHEFLIKDSKGLKLTDSQGKILEQIIVNNITSVKVMHTTNGPELLFLSNQKLHHVAASKNRLAYVLLHLSGKEDDANSVRSNISGIGTSLTLHNRGFYSVGQSFQNLSGYDQDYQAISLAAGDHDNIDFIGLDWSDGVYQTELGLQTNQLHSITETQRQLSSCPVVFAWNNGEYEFISDVLGVGGIGFAIGRHEYGQPRPWENYLLNSNQISADNGVFRIQFTEPMEESAYLDEMQIKVVDVPNQWSLTIDERMQISEPVVTGDILYYQSLISPSLVLNKLDEDVTHQALSTDKIAIDIINQDKRFLGLVDEQVITMEFEEEMIGDFHFIMNGWVEYGYSQTMFAAWQAGIVAQAPTLEYKINGEWKPLLTEFGYPAGMPRAASVPISLPEETRFLRIKTNMEVYFDQLALIKKGQPNSISEYNLKLKTANLKQVGFPKREDNSQRVPDYDFSDIQPFWDTRYMEGAYTQLGDVTELVNKADNALAIIGAGEGIELQFIDDLPKLQGGFDRYYILKFKGWAKDMDILTKGGETLNPMPYTGVVSNKAKALNLKYNNRFKAGK